jgi:hypothetical protein
VVLATGIGVAGFTAGVTCTALALVASLFVHRQRSFDARMLVAEAVRLEGSVAHAN